MRDGKKSKENKKIYNNNKAIAMMFRKSTLSENIYLKKIIIIIRLPSKYF